MPAADRVLVGGQRDRPALEPDLAGIGPRHAEQRQRQLGAAGAEKTGEPQHLAATQGEGDVLVLAGAGQPAHLQQRRRRRHVAGGDPCARSTSPVISSPMRRASTSPPAKVPTLRPSRSTVTRSAISTTSSSRWLTNTTATPWARRRSTKPSSAIDLGAGERGRGLVHEQQPGVGGETAADRDHLALGDGQGAHRRIERQSHARAGRAARRRSARMRARSGPAAPDLAGSGRRRCSRPPRDWGTGTGPGR